ncbi:MAG TPA: hypothetical protein VJL78_00050 [Candidatus Nitrosocosmicus sp.]|nr:hypothetical protein [Candidatus Nitrosocosmicus sp.]
MDFANEEFANNQCKHIRDLDPLIRFVGIANGMGTLVGTSYRKQLNALMNDDETKLYAMQAVFRAEIREDFQKNLGTLNYSVGKYDKLIRATIPLKSVNESTYYLLVSFDIEADSMFIIENKILQYIKLLTQG